MATVAQLAARPYCEIGYLFVVEGWPIAFTNRIELVGSGENSWITTDEGERTVALGLEPPKSVKLATGIVETGMLVDDGATFTIVDRDGHLIELMEDDDGTVVIERVDATSPAPETVIVSGDGSVDVTLWGAWINGEAIGAAGERRQFPILPGAPTLPGYDHAASEAAEATLRVSKVRTVPRWLEGLPCALYLIRRNTDTGQWPSWSDQYDSGYSLIWWGTLRHASAESHAWKLACDGPSSWLRKTLNVTMPSEWRSIEPYLSLNADESRIAVAFSYMNWKDDTEACKTSAYTASDVITSGQTPSDLADEIDGRLQALAVLAGTDETFSLLANGSVKFRADGLNIRVDPNTSGSPTGQALAGVLQLRMHKKAWLHMGWDLVVQGEGVSDFWAPHSSIHEVTSVTDTKEFSPYDGSATADYGKGYWEGVFTTVPLQVDALVEHTKVDGDGATRHYAPVYPNSSVTVLQSDGRQTVAVGFNDGRYCIGQLACPPADVTVGGGAADRAGFVVVRGPYRESVDEEPRQRVQLARVSWRNVADGIGADSNSRTVVWLEEWLDPRLWGGADSLLAEPWAGSVDPDPEKGLQWVPIALLGYNVARGGADRADLVLLRLLLSSGTASWSGVGDAATPVDGDNDHSAATGDEGVGNDREIADLGLCIPQQMIDWRSFVDAADALPGAKSGALNRCRLAYVGPFDSQECIESILSPRGWCFSLRGGQYGLFARHVPLDLDDVEVALTAAHVAADPDATPPAESVDFRPLEPVDLITVRYGETQLSAGEGRDAEYVVKARDPRAHARRGNAKVEIDGRSLLPPKPLDVHEKVSPHWQGNFAELWGEHLARFYGEPHAMVTVDIKGDTARDLWPGTIVSYTSEWPATRNGVYGMTARVGRVVSVERDLQTLAATVEILVEGKDPTTRRRFAPVARLVDTHTTVEARHDAATRTVYCQADAFGRGSDASDVAAFAEPSWSTAGGDAIVYVWQSWDGLTWEPTAGFYVESVNTATHTITYKAGTLSGTIWENRYAILLLAPYDDHTAGAWPLSTFGVICGTDEKFGTGNLAGFPWAE